MSYRNVILSEMAYGGLPVAYWTLGETTGTAAVDEMTLARGTGYTGTYSGGYTLGVRPGPINRESAGAPSFNGTTGYVTIADSDALTPAAITVECWVRKTDASQSGLVWKYDSAAGQRSWAMGTSVVSPLKVQITLSSLAGSFSGIQVTTTGSLVQGAWQHVAFTLASSMLLVYLNGAAAATTTNAGTTPPASLANNTIPLTLGAAKSGGSPSQFLAGQMAHIAIYNYALAAPRITAHYLAGVRGTNDLRLVA